MNGRVPELRGAKVVTIGDVMLDEYVWGQVSRISPEAPVPVVAVDRRTHLPGGAGNAAAGVAALEANSVLCSVVGDDSAGERLQTALTDCGIDCTRMVVEAERVTTVKTRVIAHSQQVVRTDFEERRSLTEQVENALIASILAAVEGVDGVLISDYAKGVVSPRVAQETIAAARARGIPVVVDPKGRDYAKYRGASVLTPNLLDTEHAASMHIESYDDLLEAGRRLQGSLDGARLLVTRGAEGMTLLSPDGSVDIAAESHDVYDVTGAGDTVVAVLAVALARGIDMEDAMRLANSGAGVAVGKVGAARVTLDELIAASG
jgi:D-glycero-beta-D-manno-heptose-7-phosphate kinase